MSASVPDRSPSPAMRSAADRPGKPPARTITALLIPPLLGALDQTIVATALPAIARRLGQPELLPWVVNAYLLTSIVSLPIYGKLGDRLGRRGTLLAALALFLLGSLLCAMSESMGQLIGFRAIQGVGAGGLFVGAMSAVAELVPMPQRARYQGLFGVVFMSAAVAGPLLGGGIADVLSWHWIFLVNLPVGLVAWGALWAWLPRSNMSGVEKSSMDYAGSAWLAVCLACVVLAAAMGQRHGWGEWQAATLLACGSIAAVSLVRSQRRAIDPILPLPLFRLRAFNAPILVGFVAGIPLFAAMTFAPLYWQSVRGLPATAAGLAMLSMIASMVAASALCGRLASRWQRYRVFPIIGGALIVVGMCGMAMAPAEASMPALLALTATGLGLGMTTQLLITLAQGAVERTRIGVATATATMFRALGGLFGLCALGLAFASALSGGMIHALHLVFALAAVAAAVQFALSWRLQDPPNADPRPGRAAGNDGRQDAAAGPA